MGRDFDIKWQQFEQQAKRSGVLDGMTKAQKQEFYGRMAKRIQEQTNEAISKGLTGVATEPAVMNRAGYIAKYGWDPLASDDLLGKGGKWGGAGLFDKGAERARKGQEEKRLIEQIFGQKPTYTAETINERLGIGKENEALRKLGVVDGQRFLNKSARKNFLYNAQKTLKKNYIVSAGLAAVALITGGLALGTIVDAIANGVRNKKAAKASLQQIA